MPDGYEFDLISYSYDDPVHVMPAWLTNNWTLGLGDYMILGRIGRFFLFIAGGIAVIIVGFFMLRGNMSMWDTDHDDGDMHDNDDNDSNAGCSMHKDRRNDDEPPCEGSI